MRYLIVSPYRLAMCAWLVLAAAGAPAFAQTTILEDPFSDGDPAGGADAAGGAWIAASNAAVAVVDDASGLGAGNALQLTSTGTFARVTTGFPSAVVLESAGDKLTVDLKLRMTRASGDNSGGIRFGLHNHNGQPVTAENAASSWTSLTETWDGYYFRGGVGATTGMRIYQDVPTAGNSAVGGSGDITIGNGTAWAIADSAAHTARIEIERTANDQNTLRFDWDGDLKQEITTATVGGAPTAFTNFTIGGGSVEIDLLVDDVVITFTEGTETLPDPIDLASRLVDWSRAGMPEGIPDYTHTVDFAAAGGDPTGRTDNTALLQSIIDSLDQDTVIFFPAGVYLFERRINIQDTAQRGLPGIILRGAGPRDTKLLFRDPVEEDAGLFDITGYVVALDRPITGGLTKGSTSVTLGSTSGIVAGDWLVIRQDNDPVAMATNRGIAGYAETIDNASGWAARVVGQVVQVTAVNGSEVTIDRPLHLDFTWPNPTATVARMVTGIGFEDFTLENGLATPRRINFDFEYAARCWIRNVHSLKAMRFHVGTAWCANLLVRDSYFNDAWRHDGGGHGYGVLLADTTTHCLVENNIFRNLRHAMIWKEGANGNVFAYNYSTDGKQDGASVAKDISGHGHYAFANLFEGNIAQFIHASDYWGPVGPNNTFLRNRVTHERILIEDNSHDQNIIGNELVSPTVPFVVVDGSSTGVYVHGNNEGGTVQWRAGEPQVVPASYLYEATPAFWNIPDPWPSIGPEHEAGQYTIPAQRRWEQGLVETFAAPLPEIEAQPVSAAAAPGGVVTLSADVYTLGPVSYQWQKDGVDLTDGASLSGANTATLTIQNVSPADAGVYRLVITGDRGTVTTAEALVSVWDPAAGHLANLSTRGQVLAGDDILIAGFVLDGAGTKTLLIRGLGPAMIKFVGEEKALADATLTLNAGARSLGSNDDWSLAEVGDLALWLGAFPITPGSKDAALRADLEAGSYTAHLAGAGGTGVALLELYVDAPAAEPRLMNISTRGHVGTGDAVMIPGIVVADSPMRLLVRGVGPELAVSFGFDSGAVLADPVLTLFDKDGRPIEVSDNWGDQTEAFTLAAVAEQVGAFALTPESLDAAILVEVEPGSYTAQVADAGGGEGIAIVEVYAAP